MLSKKEIKPESNASPWNIKLKKNKNNIAIPAVNKRKSSSSKTVSLKTNNYKIGDFVLLNNDREGIIGYKGTLNGESPNKIFYGIELLNGSMGDSDGTYADKRYFQTLPNRAIFVEVDQIRRTMVGKDYKTPRRLDRRQSLKNRMLLSDDASKQKQSEFELTIYSATDQLEAKCDSLDDIKQVRLEHRAQSNEQNVNKKKAKKKKGKKAQSLALGQIRKQYEENAMNIDNKRNIKINKMKKRKSFNHVRLDENVKNVAIKAFKKKLKKGTQKDKMKQMFQNEEKAIIHSTETIEALGFFKFLKDIPAYSHLFKTNKSKKRKRRKKKKENDDLPDMMHRKSVSSIHTMRKQRIDTKVSDNSDINKLFEANIKQTKVVKVIAVNDDKVKDMNHSLAMDKAIIRPKGRRKKTRKKLKFDDDDNVIAVVEREKTMNDEIVQNEVKKVEILQESKSEIELDIGAKADSENEGMDEMDTVNMAEYDVFDMTNSNIMLRLTETNMNILQNVIVGALSRMKTLRVIEMSNCGLSDVFMDKICNALMSDECGIWCLNIQSNPIGDDGMLSLCKLIEANKKCLTHIKLQNNKKDISTEVCEKMCEALANNHYIKVFEFAFRHFQYKDKCKKVLWRNNEAARKARVKNKIIS